MQPAEIIAIAVAMLLGVALGWFISYRQQLAGKRTARDILEAAQREAENTRRDAQVSAQEELLRAREKFDQETRQRRQELTEMEKRLIHRETNIDRKVDWLDHKTEEITRREQQVAEREREQRKLKDELDELKRLAQQELQRIARMSTEDARRYLLSQQEEACRLEAATLARRILDEARQNAEREAQRIIAAAIERIASSQVQAVTTCSLTLPNDEMKGRIIGREGRNIRAFEAATGVNVLIDDTPLSVVLSGFDPVRREVARLTMERLIADGRINPARIEEEVAKVTEEMEQILQRAGEDAVLQVGIGAVHPELIKLLGRLKFRHSFSQNVLAHSVEVAQIEALMAAELGLNTEIAKRVGLFHDIGKAVDHELAGSHAVIGAELLRKYGEMEEVVRGVACHHHEAEPVTVYGILAGAADAISASRPGARSESMELYVQRLEKLEKIANNFPGVEKSYALQAGRELRVIVEPAKVSDDEAFELARSICKRVEQELQYPGQIKVTVIRETRAIEYAK